MSKPMSEFFNGGIVTARHAALLNPGELQRADDCVYRDKDPAIWRAPGRVALNAIALGAPSGVKGLLHASYDRARVDQLLAFSGTALSASPLLATVPGVIDPLVFVEIGGVGQVAGTITGTSFVATTGFPFLASAVGATVYGPSANVTIGTVVSAVSGQSGSTGHYSTITLSIAGTNGAATLNFNWGVVVALDDSPSGAGEEILDGSQYASSYFIWFGKGAPRRLFWQQRAGTDDVLTTRLMGLDPVTAAPTITEATDSAYLWNPILGVGTYWFIITEVYSPSGDLSAAERNPQLVTETIESAYLGFNTTFDPNGTTGLPIPITVSAVTGKGVSIVFPAVVNNGTNGKLATHWNVYMYGPTSDTRSAPSLAQMRRVRTLPITQYTAGFTHIITETATAAQTKLPSTNATDDGQSQLTNPTNMYTENDGLFSYGISTASTDAPGQLYGTSKLGGFNFVDTGAYATAVIIGVRATVYCRADPSGNASDQAGFYVKVNATGKVSQRYYQSVAKREAKSIGGNFDTLGVSWAISDLPSMSVTVAKTGTAAKQRLAVDWVKLTVYFTGGTINLNGPAYRVVTYRDQIGLTVSEPVDLPPPNASTGCFFQGSLVLNDMADETAVRFSLPGRPEAFPKPYVMRFNDTKRRDRVRYLNKVSQYLIVGLENSIERVGYLPRETDTDLESGLSHEPLASDHGIPGPFAAVRFDMPGEGILLAYASIVGPFLTNGINVRPLTTGLDWSALVKTSALGSCVFRCYPKEKWLALYYCPAGATHNLNTRVVYFSYQADKIKEGGSLPVVGPMVVSARSVCEVTLTGTPYFITGHNSSGVIYQEDRGTTVPSGYQARLNDDSGLGNGKTTLSVDVAIVPLIRTRKIYGAGMDRDMREQRVLLLFSPYGSTITASSTTTLGSTTITSSAAFGSVVPGMRVKGVGIDLGTIVISKSSSSSIVVSRAANASGTATLSFDTGTISTTIRGSGIGEAVVGCDTQHGSTITGDLIEFHQDNARMGIELQIEKVPLTFDSNHDTLTWADLGTAMRLHQFTLVATDGGPEMNYSGA